MADNLARKVPATEALLDAAEVLFAERGYEAVSTRDLAERAEVNLGAIQYHFGSKAKLFVATMHRMMEHSAGAHALELLKQEIVRPEQAVATLYHFVKTFLGELLQPSGPQGCRIMFREVLSNGPESAELHEALIASVVEHFSLPLDTELQKILKILAPSSKAESLQFYSHSIMGQCSFYFSHRPFIERMRGITLADAGLIEKTARHIVSFSLQGMGRVDLMPILAKVK